MGECGRTAKTTRSAMHTVFDVGMLSLRSPTVDRQVFEHIEVESCKALPLIVAVMQAKSNDAVLACKLVSADYRSCV